MTEQEWLTCIEPKAMLCFLRRKASQRKLRLFAVACCRRVWEWVPELDSRAAVEVAEQFADGRADLQQLSSARRAAKAPRGTQSWGGGEGCAWAATERWGWLAAEGSSRMAGCAPTPAAWLRAANTRRPSPAMRRAARAAWDQVCAAEDAAQALLLRDLFHPFRPTAVEPAWRTPTVALLAEAAYAERELPSGHLDAARLAILADALEEAGCTSAELLGHLRGPGPHVRGCWAVDLILVKE